MAVMKAGRMYADGQHAFVGQVIEHVNNNPPVHPEDIIHCCFPGYLAGSEDRDVWQQRMREIVALVDERMQVLHLANLIWRREIKNRDPVVNAKMPVYYRFNDRRKLFDLPEELRWLPFHEIKPLEDERFPPVS
jgi:hypothetical protein